MHLPTLLLFALSTSALKWSSKYTTWSMQYHIEGCYNNTLDHGYPFNLTVIHSVADTMECGAAKLNVGFCLDLPAFAQQMPINTYMQLANSNKIISTGECVVLIDGVVKN